jgi:UDP-N-acetylglucosamine--dolichyl-phosphate N-acetylglucosaminephosphotransferase
LLQLRVEMAVPRSLQLTALAILGLALPAYAFTQIHDTRTRQLISASAIVSLVGFLATQWLIPKVAAKTASRGICGKDLNKRGTPAGEIPIPEAAGLAVGCVFLLCVICFEHLHYYDVGSLLDWVTRGFKGPAPRLETISEAWLVDYNAALATIGFMLFLGFADDVLDIRWRVKLMLPMFAALPLLAAYSGGTGISVPKPLQAWAGLPPYMELGVLYKVGSWKNRLLTLGATCVSSQHQMLPLFQCVAHCMSQPCCLDWLPFHSSTWWHSPSSAPTPSTSWQA